MEIVNNQYIANKYMMDYSHPWHTRYAAYEGYQALSDGAVCSSGCCPAQGPSPLPPFQNQLLEHVIRPIIVLLATLMPICIFLSPATIFLERSPRSGSGSNRLINGLRIVKPV